MKGNTDENEERFYSASKQKMSISISKSTTAVIVEENKGEKYYWVIWGLEQSSEVRFALSIFHFYLFYSLSHLLHPKCFYLLKKVSWLEQWFSFIFKLFSVYLSSSWELWPIKFWHSSNLLIWDKEENHSGISDTKKRTQLRHDILVPAETVRHKLAQVPRKKRYDDLIKCLKRLNTWWERITYVKKIFPFYVSIDRYVEDCWVQIFTKRLTYVWACFISKSRTAKPNDVWPATQVSSYRKDPASFSLPTPAALISKCRQITGTDPNITYQKGS